jgi:hypothetical protein
MSRVETDDRLNNDSIKVEVRPELNGDFTIYDHDLYLHNVQHDENYTCYKS